MLLQKGQVQDVRVAVVGTVDTGPVYGSTSYDFTPVTHRSPEEVLCYLYYY